jgi:hypothetical protein
MVAQLGPKVRGDLFRDLDRRKLNAVLSERVAAKP